MVELGVCDILLAITGPLWSSYSFQARAKTLLLILITAIQATDHFDGDEKIPDCTKLAQAAESLANAVRGESDNPMTHIRTTTIDSSHLLESYEGDNPESGPKSVWTDSPDCGHPLSSECLEPIGQQGSHRSNHSHTPAERHPNAPARALHIPTPPSSERSINSVRIGNTSTASSLREPAQQISQSSVPTRLTQPAFPLDAPATKARNIQPRENDSREPQHSSRQPSSQLPPSGRSMSTNEMEMPPGDLSQRSSLPMSVDMAPAGGRRTTRSVSPIAPGTRKKRRISYNEDDDDDESVRESVPSPVEAEAELEYNPEQGDQPHEQGVDPQTSSEQPRTGAEPSGSGAGSSHIATRKPARVHRPVADHRATPATITAPLPPRGNSKSKKKSKLAKK